AQGPPSAGRTPSRKWNWPPSNGSSGKTTAACTGTAETSHRSNWRPRTTLNTEPSAPRELPGNTTADLGRSPDTGGLAVATVSVRYIVHDVDAAISFYCEHLGFHEVMHPAPTFAMLTHDDLRLVLTAPGGGPGGGQAMPDGRVPEPGGWNRFQLEVSNIEAAVERLRQAGVRF